MTTRDRPVRGLRGAILAGRPLAVAAGLRILDRGERFGSRPWGERPAPAIERAVRGFPVYEARAAWIRHSRAKYAADPECARTPHAGRRRLGVT